MHVGVEPAILYFGTPVALLGSVDEHGAVKLAPMSSVFWLGWRAVLGLAASGRTAQNLGATGECTINLPNCALVDAVDKLALTTRSEDVPVGKTRRGYRTEIEKFRRAGLTSVASETVTPPRVAECPVQLEAVVEAAHPMAADDPQMCGSTIIFEARVQRVHVAEDIIDPSRPDHIDPNLWRPLIMSFQRFFGLGEELRPSTLATVPEHLYRSPDVGRARRIGARDRQPD